MHKKLFSTQKAKSFLEREAQPLHKPFLTLLYPSSAPTSRSWLCQCVKLTGLGLSGLDCISAGMSVSTRSCQHWLWALLRFTAHCAGWFCRCCWWCRVHVSELFMATSKFNDWTPPSGANGVKLNSKPRCGRLVHRRCVRPHTSWTDRPNDRPPRVTTTDRP